MSQHAGSPAALAARRLATMLAVVALAIRPVAAQDAEACRRDAMIVFDASGSMLQADMDGRPRIEVAREAVAAVLPPLTNQRRTGLIVYGPGTGRCNVALRVPPALGTAAEIIAELQVTRPFGNTPIGDAVRQATAILDPSGIVVVVTDGGENCGYDLCLLGDTLQALHPGIIVHVIGMKLGAAVEARTSCLAEVTGGRYAAADTLDGLKRALDEAMACPKVSLVGPPTSIP